ncbi:hypothetical protein L0U95_30800 (plasmid) [Burkholderia cenocepacia]|uniref:hypothetical protein n=1 Tax=Burkholderia cenocepacia TaxID=95486 RepID=UPI001F43472C|nr:hypothetical protein [Burkholderia cenocepacia]UJH76275.1 hypothetical protein L0U95_30800 [Burkholderia cenocepacia]
MRLDKGVALYPAIVGVLGAGATCVPLDPAFPPERARTILRESGRRRSSSAGRSSRRCSTDSTST